MKSPSPAILLLATMLLATLPACPSATYGSQPASAGSTDLSMEALAVIEQYKDDPDLADEVLDDKDVEIYGFQVEAVDGSSASMTAMGLTLVLSFSGEPALQVGATLSAVCEGDSISGKTISFHSCKITALD